MPVAKLTPQRAPQRTSWFCCVVTDMLLVREVVNINLCLPTFAAPPLVQEWFYAVPPITRAYVSVAIGVTALCALEVISPFSLYFNLKLVVFQLQLWRFVTNFVFFGAPGIDFLFHMFFLARCPLHVSDATLCCPTHPHWFSSWQIAASWRKVASAAARVTLR